MNLWKHSGAITLLHATHVSNHLTKKRLFTRFSARGVLYVATLIKAQTVWSCVECEIGLRQFSYI